MRVFLNFFCLLFISGRLIYSQTPVVYPGFPKITDSVNNFPAPIGIDNPLITDLDRDGQKEIITGVWSPFPITKLYVIKSNGQYQTAFPKVYPIPLKGIASGDVNGDGYLEIVMRFENSIDVIDRFGNSTQGFPVIYSSGPSGDIKFISLYDLDSDGFLELITSKDGEFVVFNYNGQIRSGWPRYISGRARFNPAIGDIDGDGFAEIILSTLKTNPVDSSALRIFRHNGVNFSNNWPVYTDSGYINWAGSPSLYIDRTNLDSTFICVPWSRSVGVGNYIYRLSKYNIYGSVTSQTFNILRSIPGTLVMGDINRDSSLELATGGSIDFVSAYSNNLSPLNGWPQLGNGASFSTLGLGKLKSGNELNILSNMTGADYRHYGYIFIYNLNGTQLPWSPLRPRSLIHSISCADLNSDGSVELIATGDNFDSYMVHVFTIPGVSFNYNTFPWPQYCHDRYRTNQYGFVPPDDPIGIKPVSNYLPEKFNLYQNYPNPFNPKTMIPFNISKTSFVKIIVYDILGREIAKLLNETLQTGTYNLDFDAGRFSSGVYLYRLEVNSNDPLNLYSYSDVKKMVLVK